MVTFAEVLRAGIQARGLSLERVQDHLRQRGVSISLATLSYWQSGRSQPERRKSLAALASLEEILRLPSGALNERLGTLRLRGRPVRQSPAPLETTWPRPDPVQAALDQVDTGQDEQLTRLSVHDLVRIGPDRTERYARTRQILRSEQDGTDRLVFIFGVDETGGELPLVHVRRPGSLGRVVADMDAGVLVAELVFDRALGRGETVIAEYLVRLVNPEIETRYGRRFRYATREYALEMRFHERALPQHSVQYAVADGPERTRPIALDGARTVHHVALGVMPGTRCGIRWRW